MLLKSTSVQDPLSLKAALTASKLAIVMENRGPFRNSSRASFVFHLTRIIEFTGMVANIPILSFQDLLNREFPDRKKWLHRSAHTIMVDRCSCFHQTINSRSIGSDRSKNSNHTCFSGYHYHSQHGRCKTVRHLY